MESDAYWNTDELGMEKTFVVLMPLQETMPNLVLIGLKKATGTENKLLTLLISKK